MQYKKHLWQRLAAALILLGILIVSLSICATSSPRGINEETYQRIQKGMTISDVIDLLGCQPGNYSTPDANDRNKQIERLVLPEAGPPTCRYWISDEMVILVYFDATGERVEGKWRCQFMPQESLLTRILRNLGI